MGVDPKVSIVILNHNHPEIIDICLRSLEKTEGVPYEVVVVDNGSEQFVLEELARHRAHGRITTLVAEDTNHYFAGGNNIGVRNCNRSSEYILLLNSDVAILRPDWLEKVVSWMEGTQIYWPSIWGLKPTIPSKGPRDIVSVGWAHDAEVFPYHVRPDGFCCMIRRSIWQDISLDFPWKDGFEEMISIVVRNGAKAGVLSQYGSYLVHREGASGEPIYENVLKARVSDIPAWYHDLYIETLDFTLGPDEHSSYMWW